MHRLIQSSYIIRKNQLPNVHGQHQAKNAKNENKLESLIQTVKIYSDDIGMEFGIERCAMLIMKSGKWQKVEGIELPNKDTIRTLGEKETYKYLGILEADIIKQAEMKEKSEKNNISGERESYSKPNYIAEITSKE